MKRFLVMAMLLSVIAVQAVATPTVTVGRLIGAYPGAPTLLVGEFQLTPNAELGAMIGGSQPFQSFCLEAYEPISVGDTYAAVVNDEAILGGGRWPSEAAGPGGGDMLSPETAYLYTQFRAGTLAGYDYTFGPGRGASALALQSAIWYLEGEDNIMDFNTLSPEARSFVLAAQRSGWTNIGDVRVLNLTGLDADGGKHLYQDMLVMVPVPAPGAMVLGAIGVALVGWVRRRKQL
jgi:hypothetical protein